MKHAHLGEGVTVGAVKAAAGISWPYASQICANPPLREPSDAVALKVWRGTGAKLGRLRGLDDEEIKILERFVIGGSAPVDTVAA